MANVCSLMLSKMRKEIYLYVIINIYLSFSIRKTADIVGLSLENYLTKV